MRDLKQGENVAQGSFGNLFPPKNDRGEQGTPVGSSPLVYDVTTAFAFPSGFAAQPSEGGSKLSTGTDGQLAIGHVRPALRRYRNRVL